MTSSTIASVITWQKILASCHNFNVFCCGENWHCNILFVYLVFFWRCMNMLQICIMCSHFCCLYFAIVFEWMFLYVWVKNSGPIRNLCFNKFPFFSLLIKLPCFLFLCPNKKNIFFFHFLNCIWYVCVFVFLKASTFKKTPKICGLDLQTRWLELRIYTCSVSQNTFVLSIQDMFVFALRIHSSC